MPLSGTTIRNRLKIEDLLDIADKEQLKGYRWADGVCDAVNAYLSLNHRLSIDSTGLEVAAAIKQLPVQVQIRLSYLLIDVETGEIHAGRKTMDNFPAVTEEDLEEEQVETAEQPTRQHSGGYERYEDEMEPERHPPRRRPHEYKDRADDPNTSPNSSIMMMIAGVLVVIALLMTFTASKMSQENGKPMESSTLEVVLKVLGDVFKSSANTNPANRGTSTTDSTMDDTMVDEDVETNPRYQDETATDENAPQYGP